MIEGLVTFGYAAAALGIVACIAAYFLLPRIIKSLTEDSNNEVE